MIRELRDPIAPGGAREDMNTMGKKRRRSRRVVLGRDDSVVSRSLQAGKGVETAAA